MCGRYASTMPDEMMEELFKLLNHIDLVPRWVKDPREFPLLVNARVETMDEKPAFRDALKHGRCIIPASDYYEWHTNLDKSKQLYYITMANDRPMALAGLYATWSGPEGEEIDSLATIAVPTNGQLSQIHHRMPAILEGEAIDDWLNVREVRAAEAAQLVLPLPDGR
ncbi:MAG: SOS response-associated peptidase [Candidatus Devosia euplotis]|nr:SOS response-associated peptidase [Candidatus Devosia euplotis]